MHRRLWAVACLASIAAVATPGATADPGQCADADLSPAPDNLDRISASVSCLVDAARADRGQPPLGSSPELAQAAQRMSALMVQEQFFSHVTPEGRTLVDRVLPTGYLPRSDDWLLGENLAWGSGDLGTPRSIVGGWMNSAEHRANIFAADYQDLGIGVTLGAPAPGRQGGATFAADFGSRHAGRLSVDVPRRFVAELRRGGSRSISYSAGCSEPCTLVARLYRGPTATASGRLRLRRGGTGILTVRLSAKDAKPLLQRAQTRLPIVTKAVGTRVARTTRVTLETG